MEGALLAPHTSFVHLPVVLLDQSESPSHAATYDPFFFARPHTPPLYPVCQRFTLHASV